MPSFRDLYREPLLAAKNLKNPIKADTIEAVNPENTDAKNKGEKIALVITLADSGFRVALNKTNALRLGEAFGDDYDKWLGRKVSVTTHQTQFAGRPCAGLLVTPIKK